ncbi:MAG: hypothetical protein J7575_08305, partial [Chloroflexi bacterium]|nr:hypothetical protein [Chloroflexota bacterium]
ELVEVQRRHEERLARLEATVQELVEVQRRHEERLARLEAIVEALVEAQRRTEERLTRLEDAVQELVKVVQKHEERLETIEQILAKALIRMDRLESQVGQLANRLGLDLEVDAEEVLRSLLEDRRIRMLQEPFALEVDGEMDVVVPVELPTGERPWIIVEVKGRLRRKELGEFLQRLQRPSIQEELQRAGVQKPYLPYAFGLRVYADVDRMAEEAGVGVLSFRGERVAPRLWE